MINFTTAVFGIVWNANPSVIPGLNIPRWYGVMWALGIYVAYILLNKIYKHEKMSENAMDKTFMYIVLGAILGARLGHCLFYQPDYYLSNPIEILKIWEGGLASHGGTIGILIGAFILVRKILKVEMLWFIDRLTGSAAVTAAFIRLGNLFNHEIVGIPTQSSLGFKFLRHDISGNEALNLTVNSRPKNVDAAYELIANSAEYVNVLAMVPLRYPTQLIESFSYFIILIIVLYLFWKTNAGYLRGFITGVFLFLLFTARFFVEFIKEHQDGIDQGLEGLNMGQYLSLPFIVVGLFLMFRKLRGFSFDKNVRNSLTADSVVQPPQELK